MDTFIKERLAKEGGLEEFENLAPNENIESTNKKPSNIVEASMSRLDWSFDPNGNVEDNYLAISRKTSAILQEAAKVEKQPDETALQPAYLESGKPESPLLSKDSKCMSTIPQKAAQSKKRDANNRSNSANGSEKEKPPARKKTRTHPGSHGDPRMNQAVKLRMNDPNLSLIDALIAGGFVFPDLHKPGGKRSECKDVNGVTVYQRRNQLLRRIRLEKKKEQDSSS